MSSLNVIYLKKYVSEFIFHCRKLTKSDLLQEAEIGMDAKSMTVRETNAIKSDKEDGDGHRIDVPMRSFQGGVILFSVYQL